MKVIISCAAILIMLGSLYGGNRFMDIHTDSGTVSFNLANIDSITFRTVLPAGMKAIPGGTFQMGSTTGNSDEVPVHTVTVSSFYMDSTEVTQGDFNTLMGFNPSYFTGDTKRPVETVTWFDAVLCCNVRSKRDGMDTCYAYTGKTISGNNCTNLSSIVCDFSKKGYRLPTEAEWEYAYRAGTTTDYYWGSGNMDSYAWYYNNSGGTTHPVAGKLPNGFGLYDMNGNALELCNDWYLDTYYSSSPSSNPLGPVSGSNRVSRGGCWASIASNVSSTLRNNFSPDYCSSIVGFRVVLPAQ